MGEMLQDLKCSISFYVSRILESILLLCFSDYKMHQTIRRTLVLEKENRKKNPLHCYPLPPSEPGKLHSDYKMHPHFPPKFGGGCVL